MKILVTGGTGFVGSHVCCQLLAAGQQVRLLVRNADKARDYYASLNVALPELVVGDVTDADSVKAALQGCDAVVHAAAGTPIGSDSIDKLFAVNVGGVKNVVGTAVDMGLQSIVHVSSITAIFNADASKVTAGADPAPSSMPYGQSKVEAEYYVRKLQAKGAPVSIVYPGAIIGPNDPGLSDTFKALQHRINNGFRIIDDGGMQHIDVRDLAAFIVSLTVDGGGGRYLMPGVYCKWSELADIIENVSGCQLQRIPAKGWKLRLVGRIMDFMRKFKTVDSPISAETMRYATLWPNIAITDELTTRNLVLHSPEDTFRDSLAWMVKAGHLKAEQLPSLGAQEQQPKLFYFEDYVVGDVQPGTPYTVEKQEVIEFATKWDPQPWHVDEEAAKASMFGGLTACSAHIFSIFCISSQEWECEVVQQAIASLGFDDMRMYKPVYAGDTLRCTSTVELARLSKSKNDRGIVACRCELFNQEGELVFSILSSYLMARNPALL